MKRLHTTLLGMVLLVSTALAQPAQIVGYEYWFDQNDNDAARTFVQVTPGSNISLTDAIINTTGLALESEGHFRERHSLAKYALEQCC